MSISWDWTEIQHFIFQPLLLGILINFAEFG